MKWFDLSRTVVLPAHCDGYGHMNVRHYAAFFDDAGWHILAMAGISLAEVKTRGLGTVMASLTIEFHHEITAGQLALLRRLGCRDGQGYALSPPIEAAAARELAAATLVAFPRRKGRGKRAA